MHYLLFIMVNKPAVRKDLDEIIKIFQNLYSIPSMPQALYRCKGNAVTIKSLQVKQIR